MLAALEIEGCGLRAIKMLKANEDPCLEGQAAYKAIKSHFVRLVPAITRESIPDKLYSEGILGDDTIDTLLNQSQTERHKGRQFVRELQNAVQIKPECFTTLCEVLAEEPLSKELSADLKGETRLCLLLFIN